MKNLIDYAVLFLYVGTVSATSIQWFSVEWGYGMFWSVVAFIGAVAITWGGIWLLGTLALAGAFITFRNAFGFTNSKRGSKMRTKVSFKGVTLIAFSILLGLAVLKNARALGPGALEILLGIPVAIFLIGLLISAKSPAANKE